MKLPNPITMFLMTLALVVAAPVLRFGISLRAERLAIAEIQSHGGWVIREPRGPAWLRARLGEERMREFDTITHASFCIDSNRFRKTQFRSGIDSSRPPDRRKHPKGPDIQIIDDRSISCVRGISSLRTVDLDYTNISDVGIEHVCCLQNLEYLDINGTDVSDASIPNLTRLTELKELSVRGTKITDAGIAELKMALPQLTVLK